MKRAAFVLMAGLLAGAVSWADPPPVPTTPGQNILVWIAGKDPKTSQQLELDIQIELAKHQIQGQKFSALFPNGLPASPEEAIAKMRASGSGRLLVMRRRSAINWETPTKEKNMSSLRLFLGNRSQILYPKNQVEADSAPIVVPNLYGNTVMEIVKGEGLLFDLAEEKLAWRGNTEIKSAKDLPLNDYYRLVAEKVAGELTAAHLIPPKTK